MDEYVADLVIKSSKFSINYTEKDTAGTIPCAGFGNNSRYREYENNKINVTAYNYQPFNMVNTPITGNQQTVPGVCDEKYVYFCWERGSTDTFISGSDHSAWVSTGGSFNWMNISTTIFIKLDRFTGEIVLARPMSSVTGLQTTDIHLFEKTGDDLSRGPFFLYGKYLYITGQSQRYPSILKMKCKNFNLIWRKIVPEGNLRFEIPGYPSLSVSGIILRQIHVIPPQPKKNIMHPIVIVASVSLEYGTITYDTLLKIFNYYRNCGRMWAYSDEGYDAKLMWEFNSTPDPYVDGNLLEETSFSRNSDDKIDDTLLIYTPIYEGMVFKKGDPILLVPNTIGRCVLLTGNVNKDGTWEYAIFVFKDNEIFNSSKTYIGDNNGIPISVKGEIFIGQPIVKTLYKTMIGKYIISGTDVYELNHEGGGIYGTFCIDYDNLSVIFGTGNGDHTPYGEEYTLYKYLRPGVEFPVINGWNDYTSYLRKYTAEQLANDNIRELYIKDLKKLSYDVDTGMLLTNSPRYNRLLIDSIVSLNIKDGGLNWAYRTHCLDIVDHSITLGGTTAKSSVFRSNGANMDAMLGATFVVYNDKKYLVCSNKARTFILDYSKLKNTLTHVDGDKTIDYKKGIKYNKSEKSCVFKDNQVNYTNIASFCGIACNGKTFIRRSCNSSDPTPYMAFINDKIEKHGIVVNGAGNKVSSVYPETTSRSMLLAYDIPKLIDHYNNTRLNIIDNQANIWKWVFVLNERVGTADVGSVQIYGNGVIAGSNRGVLYTLDIESGTELQTLTNYEGMSCGPVVVNGMMYSYGGNNKWNPNKVFNYATYIMTASPYGM